jgi:hypothetical protein
VTDERYFRRPHEQRIRIDHYVYFPEGLPLSGNLTITLVQPAPVPSQPTHATLTVKGSQMPGQITVDTTNETATIDFVDDHGDVAAAPAGAVVAFTSDNPAVATIAADSANPLQGDVTPVSVGTANLSATITGAFEPDGVTPFTVASVAVTVSAGAAAGADLVLSA